MMDGLRRAPRPLLLALAGKIVWTLISAIATVSAGPPRLIASSTDLTVVSAGVWLAFYGLGFAGCRELARGLTGRARVGAHLASAGFVAGLLASIAESAATVYVIRAHPSDPGPLLELVQSASAVTVWVTAIGLGLATARPMLAVIGGLVAFFTAPMLPLAESLYGWIPVSSYAGATLIITAFALAGYLCMLALAVHASQGVDTAIAPGLGSRGLRRAAWALRIVAVGSLLSAAAGVPLSHQASAATSAWGIVVAGALLMNVVVCVGLALGVLEAARSGAADLPRWPLVVAAGLALWAAGSVVKLAPGYLQRAGELDIAGLSVGHHYGLSLSRAGELGFGAAIVCLLGSIQAFAHRRGLRALAASATVRLFVYVFVLLAGFGAEYLLQLPHGAGAGVFGVITVAGVSATTWLAASTCRAAAVALDGEPALPSAKLVHR
jgi:hypothetical protein